MPDTVWTHADFAASPAAPGKWELETLDWIDIASQNSTNGTDISQMGETATVWTEEDYLP